MPLTYIQTTRDYTIVVWKVTEDLDLLSQHLQLDPAVARILETCKPHRKKELIGTRYLLDYLLAESVTVVKSPHGCPHILEYPEVHLSLSHSGDYTAVMLSREYQQIGIDIQMYKESIDRIAAKFMKQDEIANSTLASQHYYWGIKESVFKAWSLGGVDFKEMIKVDPFKIRPNHSLNVQTHALFLKDDVVLQFDASGMKIDNLFITWVIPSDTKQSSSYA